MDIEPFTSVLPSDEPSRSVYTYLGKRVFGLNLPFYLHDTGRTRPSLVLGATGCGKTDFLLSLSFQDATKGRPVIFIDGKCDMATLNKLYYYNAVIAKRPFLALLPTSELDHLSHSWNPLLSPTTRTAIIADAFFNAYRPPSQKHSDAEVYYSYQRSVFTNLLNALHKSGMAYSIQDLAVILEDQTAFEALPNILPPDSMPFFMNLMNKRNEAKNKYKDNMQNFLNHLKLFESWTLNSYNPSIQLDALIQSDTTLYVGLPVNSERFLMGTIGNLFINQLKALSATIQQSENISRRAISCIVDEAGTFVDEGMADWICKVRTSGFLLTLGMQGIPDLERISPAFARQIVINAPHMYMFNPNDAKTARWFSEISGTESLVSPTANVKVDEEGTEETGGGSLRQSEHAKIPSEAVLKLRTGQVFYRPAETVDRPFLLAGSYLPDPPNREDCRYHRTNLPGAEERVGLYWALQRNTLIKKYASKN